MRLRKDGKPVGALDRRPKNLIEAQCYDQLHAAGWKTVTKKGMPDFFCMGEKGHCILVECKQDGHKLTRAQELLFEFLSRHDVPCYVYAPGKGFRRVGWIKKKL